VGVRKLTETELADPDKLWWKNKHDLVEEGINVKMIKAFVVHRKTKENGKTASHAHIRKYNDAIIYGAKEAKQRLPITYYEEMEKFLAAFKKETTKAKKDSILDKQEANPILKICFLLSYSGL
jgi:hypothetical protein